MLVVQEKYITKLDTFFVEIEKKDTKNYKRSVNFTVAPSNLVSFRYKQKPNYNYKNELSYSLQASIDYKINKHFYSSIGVQFIRTAEKVRQTNTEYKETEHIYSVTVDIVQQEINGVIVDIPIVEERKDIVKTGQKYDFNFSNKLYFINIPIGLGYYFTAKKFNYSLLIAPTLSILINQNEKFIENNQEKNIAKSAYNRVLFSSILKGKVEYLTSKRTKIIAEIEYSRLFSSIYKNSSKTIENIGLGIGLGWNF